MEDIQALKEEKKEDAKQDQEQNETSIIQVKPPKSLDYGTECNARLINIRRPPQKEVQTPKTGPAGVSPGGSTSDEEKKDEIRHNLWIFLRSME